MTMREDGILKVLKGLTLEEDRVTAIAEYVENF